MIIVMNADTLAVSEYSMDDVIAVAEVGGETYFLEPTAIKRQSSSAALDFDGYAETGEMNLAPVGSESSLAQTQALLACDNPMTLTVTTDVNGTECSAVYLVADRTGEKERPRMTKLGKGVVGPSWKIRLGPKAGSYSSWSCSGLTVTSDRERIRR